VIRYPDDQATEAEADRHGIPNFVLVRDLVRIVEVLNLARQDFFGTQSVLAGSMALRCFNTPRFTVYDADFATTVEPNGTGARCATCCVTSMTTSRSPQRS